MLEARRIRGCHAARGADGKPLACLLGAATAAPLDRGSAVDLTSRGHCRRARLKVLPLLPALGKPLPPCAPRGAIAATRVHGDEGIKKLNPSCLGLFYRHPRPGAA